MTEFRRAAAVVEMTGSADTSSDAAALRRQSLGQVSAHYRRIPGGWDLITRGPGDIAFEDTIDLFRMTARFETTYSRLWEPMIIAGYRFRLPFRRRSLENMQDDPPDQPS